MKLRFYYETGIKGQEGGITGKMERRTKGGLGEKFRGL